MCTVRQRTESSEELYSVHIILVIYECCNCFNWVHKEGIDFQTRYCIANGLRIYRIK